MCSVPTGSMLPYDAEAEQAVLGAVLMDSDRLSEKRFSLVNHIFPPSGRFFSQGTASGRAPGVAAEAANNSHFCAGTGLTRLSRSDIIPLYE